MQTHNTRSGRRLPPAPPLLVSFSGIDGAGKTTQIENLTVWLREAGLRVSIVTFWDDVAALRGLRESLGHFVFKGEAGVGSRDKPVRRRDKDVQAWYLLPIRLTLCLLDTLKLTVVWARIRRTHRADVVIFDRYLYDQLANLDVSKPIVRACAQLSLRVMPHPDVAYLLDTEPELARERKPEYPLAFLRKNRQGYLEIGRLAGISVIPCGTLEQVQQCLHCEMKPWLTSMVALSCHPVLTSKSG